MNLTALITGASSGIGLELAKLYAADGYTLVLVARRKEELERIARDFRNQHKIEVDVIAMDLSKPNSAENLCKTLKEKNREIDVLVNNAGFALNSRFMNSSLPVMQQMMHLNMVTLTELTYLLLPAMKERRYGKVLNVASLAGYLPCPNLAVYAATKSYVLSFSEALAEEVREFNISVTAACPGSTETDFHRVANNENCRGASRKDPVESVAKELYKATAQGKTSVITGMANKSMPIMARLLPRIWLIKFSGYMTDEVLVPKVAK